MKIHVCPNCGNRTFSTVSHVAQTWVVDEEGNFIKEETSCDEVIHGPDDGNIWTCTNCGAEAAIAETVALDAADAVEKLQDVLDDCTIGLKQYGDLYEVEAESFSLDSYEAAERLMQAMGISGEPFAVIADNGPVLVYVIEKGTDIRYKALQPYITRYLQFYDQCLVEAGEENADDVTAGADHLFEAAADVDAVVGSFLYTYTDNELRQACRDMEDNPDGLAERDRKALEIVAKLLS